MQGTIKTLTDKGYGFIAAKERGGKDLFFHSKELQGVQFADLQIGDTLEFSVAEGEKGPYAANITLVN